MQFQENPRTDGKMKRQMEGWKDGRMDGGTFGLMPVVQKF